jgi:hypothetical protein
VTEKQVRHIFAVFIFHPNQGTSFSYGVYEENKIHQTSQAQNPIKMAAFLRSERSTFT